MIKSNLKYDFFFNNSEKNRLIFWKTTLITLNKSIISNCLESFDNFFNK